MGWDGSAESTRCQGEGKASGIRSVFRTLGRDVFDGETYHFSVQPSIKIVRIVGCNHHSYEALKVSVSQGSLRKQERSTLGQHQEHVGTCN